MSGTIDRLKAAENERQRAIAARQRATYALADLIVQGRGEGLTMTEIAEAIQLNRGQVYQLAALATGEG
jgi:DNA-directed RNA polymerase specialized sigma24 family protein